MKNRRAFTLIELLLTVGIISLLAVAVFVALNPSKRLLDTKNARRTTDVDTILSAIHQSIVDNRGNYPTGLSAGMLERQLGTAGSGCSTTLANCNVTIANDACLNLMLVASAQDLLPYLAAMPVDPDGTAVWPSGETGYSVVVNSDGIVTVRACGAEGGASIAASR